MGNTNGRGSLGDSLEGSVVSERMSSSVPSPRPGSSPAPIPTFHTVHGENVRLFKNGHMAKRVESFCKGLAFSARPIPIDETVCLKFTEMATNWSGVLRFGVTNTDPASLFDSLPKFACPDLTTKEGNWAKALAERYCQQSAILHFYIKENGELYYGINGVVKGLFLSGINTASPLWLMVDIYGNSTAVEFLDPADVRFKPSKKSRNATSPSSAGPSRQQSLPADSEDMAALALAGPSQRVSLDLESRNRSISVGNAASKYHQGVSFQALPLHSVHGKNVALTADKSVAGRAETEYAAGYVFTSRPVKLNEKVVIQILSVLPDYSGGLAFGLTSCDPIHLRPDSLPDDSDDLLERSEYWVGIKDIAASPKATDELAFYIDDQGRVHFYRNSAPAKVVMHVDQTQRMWMWLDVYGSTHKIKVLGSTSISSRGTAPVRRQNTLPTNSGTTNTQQQPLRVNLPPSTHSRGPPPTPPSCSTPPGRPPAPPPRPPGLSRAPKPAPAAAAPKASQEVMDTEEMDECTVCMSARVDCVLYTCGHMCMCFTCAEEQWGTKGECPICRSQIRDVIRTYRT